LIGYSLLVVLAVLKATNEPLLSNKWNFYLYEEGQAVRWAEQALPGRRLWTAFDERVNAAVSIRQDQARISLKLDQYDLEPETRDLLVSDLTRLRSERLEQALPLSADDFVTYDNGRVQIFHLRPRSPFQK
jgi:hypothetical protein